MRDLKRCGWKARMMSLLLAVTMVMTVPVSAIAETDAAAQNAEPQSTEIQQEQTGEDQVAADEVVTNEATTGDEQVESEPEQAVEEQAAPQEEQPDAALAESEEAEPTEETTLWTEEESYSKRSFYDLNAVDGVLFDAVEGELEKAPEIAVNSAEKGLVVTQSVKDMANTRISFDKTFDFGEGTVGRLEIDAIAESGKKVTACFYLDDESDPFAQITLNRQKRKGKWYTKTISQSVLKKGITGQHRVSIRLVPAASDGNVLVLLRSVTMAKSTIPMIYFDIDEEQGTIASMNSDPEHETECYGDMIIETPKGYVNEYGDSTPLADNKTEKYSMEYIRGRGNSTWMADKKPYKIKLDKKQNLFGMGKNKHWVLIADFYDPSHLRNKSTYWLGEKLGMQGTPQCVYVDVVMNGEYYGSYLLAEQIRVDKGNRVDIDEMSEEDVEGENLTGGYLISMEPYGDENPVGMFSTEENNFYIESPDFEDYTSETAEDAIAVQKEYIQKYFQKIEDAVNSPNFTLDEKHYPGEGGNKYSEYLDIESAAKYWWIQEFSSNGDAYGSGSTYLYKPRNGKLMWGPLWDFDYVAWGNNEYDDLRGAEYWFSRERVWFSRMLADDEFVKAATDHWPVLKEALQELTRDGGQLDKYAEQIRYSQKYNKELYGNNYDDTYADKTFQDDVDQLRGWINHRIDWMDDNLDTLKKESYTITLKVKGKVYKKLSYVEGDGLSNLPVPPADKGYVFAGWYDSKYGNRVYNGDLVSEDMTLNARFVKASKIKPVSRIALSYDTYYAPFYGVYFNYYGGHNDTFTINYVTDGGTGQPTDIAWSSGNTSVIRSLGDGEFEIIGTGTATITAKARKGTAKATCKVIVYDMDNEPMFGDITGLSRTSITVPLKSWKTIKLKTDGEAVNDYSIRTWFSMNENVATVVEFGEKAVIQGNKVGTTTACCTDEYGNVFKCKVTVVDPKNQYNEEKKHLAPGTVFTRNNVKYKVMTVTTNGGTVKVIGMGKKASTLKIPATEMKNRYNYKVVSIANKAFKGRTCLKKVVIGKNVKTIGEKAFYGCKNLKTIKLVGKKTKKIKNYAFGNIPVKKSFYVKKGKTTITKYNLNKAHTKKFKVRTY